MEQFVRDFCAIKKYTTEVPESVNTVCSFTGFVRKGRRPQLSFDVNLDDFVMMSASTKPSKKITLKENLHVIEEVPSVFIAKIKSLGFAEKDAPRLFASKEDWFGINSGGRVNCCEPGCDFSAPAKVNSLVDHCLEKHEWRDYPCTQRQCNFIAFSRSSFNRHLGFFHKKSKSKHFEHKCSICKSTFTYETDLKRHLKIHNNEVDTCAFCQYRTTDWRSLRHHEYVHFGIKKFHCPKCPKKYTQIADMRKHFEGAHEGLRAKCPICNYVSQKHNVQNHILYKHKILGSSWDREKKIFVIKS